MPGCYFDDPIPTPYVSRKRPLLRFGCANSRFKLGASDAGAKDPWLRRWDNAKDLILPINLTQLASCRFMALSFRLHALKAQARHLP